MVTAIMIISAPEFFWCMVERSNLLLKSNQPQPFLITTEYRLIILFYPYQHYLLKSQLFDMSK